MTDETTVETTPNVDVTPVEPQVTPQSETDTTSEQFENVIQGANASELAALMTAQKARIASLNKENQNHRLGKKAAMEAAEALKTELERVQAELQSRTASLTAAQQQAVSDMQQQISAMNQQLEELKSAKAQAEQVAQQAKIDSLKIKIGTKYRLSDILISRLQGTTEAEIEADAQLVKAALPQQTIDPDASYGAGDRRPRPTPSNAVIKQQKKGQYSPL